MASAARHRFPGSIGGLRIEFGHAQVIWESGAGRKRSIVLAWGGMFRSVTMHQCFGVLGCDQATAWKLVMQSIENGQGIVLAAIGEQAILLRVAEKICRSGSLSRRMSSSRPAASIIAGDLESAPNSKSVAHGFGKERSELSRRVRNQRNTLIIVFGHQQPEAGPERSGNDCHPVQPSTLTDLVGPACGPRQFD